MKTFNTINEMMDYLNAKVEKINSNPIKYIYWDKGITVEDSRGYGFSIRPSDSEEDNTIDIIETSCCYETVHKFNGVVKHDMLDKYTVASRMRCHTVSKDSLELIFIPN